MPKTNNKSKERCTVSLFAGCGGFDLGFKDKGYRTLAAYDCDPKAVASFNLNNEPVAEVCDLRGGLPLTKATSKPECVIAGPPCQGFSSAGKRDPDDPRNNLLPEAGRIAASLDPEVIVIENVPGVRIGKPAKHWDATHQILRNANYKTHEQLCDARDLGLAQSRRRVFLFAWKSDRQFPETPPPENAGRLDETLVGVETIEDHSPVLLEVDSKAYAIAQRIGPGQKLCNVRGGIRSVHTWHIPEVFGETTVDECHMLELIMSLRRKERLRSVGDSDPVTANRLRSECGGKTDTLINALIRKGYIRRKGPGYDLTHTFNGKFRRLRWETPAYTVDTRFGDPNLFLHPNENRPFTLRETLRIQSFPDWYKFESTKASNFRYVGNAVPPKMGSFAADIAKKLSS